ncbi:uncharacterized protein LOC130424837 [Triplophysa dalaica]|uniref:uncharacterized protein LOC130424837 n=1 Tax=Triplophysa dalaica TaxID=1582913 RepID=UPI0024DFCBF0|nr:uncharacterized protein LOC130424837 [Triplophysa dalaica]
MTTHVSSVSDMGNSANVNPPAKCSRADRTPIRSSERSPTGGGIPSGSSRTHSETMCDVDEMSLAASEGDWHPTLPNPNSTPSGRVQEEAEVMSSVLTRGCVVPEVGAWCKPRPPRVPCFSRRCMRSCVKLGTLHPRTVPVKPALAPLLPSMVRQPRTASRSPGWNVRLRSTCAADGYHLGGDRPLLPSKARKTSASLVSKACDVAGQAASSLYALAILQVRQARALRGLHEGKADPGIMQDLRATADSALRATKAAARALGRTMSTVVVQERHPRLYLVQKSDSKEVRFLDALISQGGLLVTPSRTALSSFLTAKQTVAINHIFFTPRLGRLQASKISRDVCFPATQDPFDIGSGSCAPTGGTPEAEVEGETSTPSATSSREGTLTGRPQGEQHRARTFTAFDLPRHRPFPRFACERRAYQYRVLPFGLSLTALSP